MNLPKQIKRAGHNVKILFPYQFQERQDLQGQWKAAQNEIRIASKDSTDNDYANSQILITFLHEILHACDEMTGHNIFTTEQGEKALNGISEILFQVITDNNLDFNELLTDYSGLFKF